MAAPPLLESREGSLLTLTLNRPDARNAISTEMVDALQAAAERAAKDTAVRGVILTGAGKAFCAGGDIKDMEARAAKPDESVRRLREKVKPAVLALAGLPKPTFAWVNGDCVGAGLSLALACDFVLAASDARLGAPFVRVGLGPDSGASHFLLRRVGFAEATRLAFTGTLVSAHEALRTGLVDEVHDAEGLGRRVREVALEVTKHSPVALAAAKQLLGDAQRRSLAEQLDGEAEAQRACYESEEHRAAVKAFLERKK